MANAYKTRRHQFHAFRREFVRDSGITLTRQQSRLLSDLLKCVATCAAIEERSRCLGIIRSDGGANEIVATSIYDVLGYTRKKKDTP